MTATPKPTPAALVAEARARADADYVGVIDADLLMRMAAALAEQAERVRVLTAALTAIIANRKDDIGPCDDFAHGCDCSECVARRALAEGGSSDV